MALARPVREASKLLDILNTDMQKLMVLDNYRHGRHTGPYVPENADAEYRLLAERCVTNWMPLLVRTPAQAMYVDGFKSATGAGEDPVSDAAWQHWQRSGLDSKQGSLYEGAFALGHAFTVTEQGKSRRDNMSRTRVLSALNTSAVFVDAANDIDPIAALTVESWPTETFINGQAVKELGRASMWDDTFVYQVKFDLASLDKRQVVVGPGVRHGASECPVTRFPAAVDLEGRTMGVIEPMIPVQDRINQTVFDLLMVQTNGSFEVRWATGMAPPLKKRVVYLKDMDGNVVYDPDTNQPVVEDIVDAVDENGRPIPEDVQISAKRMMFAEDPDAKFGSLAGTPLAGYIDSIDMSVRHLAMLSQTPPTHMMGSIVNLSAEAMASAEVALTRKIQAFKTSFGESWERVVNISGEMDGTSTEWDNNIETQWRDMEGQSFGKMADALLKLKELEIPKRGLWSRVPGVTATELDAWEEEAANDPAAILSSAMVRGQAPNTSSDTMADVDADLE